MINAAHFPVLNGARPLPGGVQVFGTGDVVLCDKSRMFVDHADAIARSGFSIPPRVIFAEDRLDTIFRHNHLADGLRSFRSFSDSPLGSGRLMFPAGLLEEISAVSVAIHQLYGDIPVVVRSSAMGDARGTGVYRSRHARNDPKEIMRAMLGVLYSYFDHHAQSWRLRAGAPPGFEIIIEPQISQDIPDPEGRQVAPLISGMGYSSSGIGPGFIKISFGLGGGWGPRLTRAALQTYGYDARRYFVERTGPAFLLSSFHLGAGGDPHSGYPHSVNRDSFASLLEGVSFEPIFAGLESLESDLANPVYGEWTLHAPKRRPYHYLTQLAIVPLQKEKWEFGRVDDVLFTLEDVRRGRDLDIGAIVYIEHHSDLDNLAAWNAMNSAYLLIYGEAAMAHVSQRECPLQMQHISSASAMMMAHNVLTAHGWEEHLRGLAESLDMMIGKGKFKETSNFLNWQSHCDVENGLPVYRRPMSIRYSSSSGIAVVTPRGPEPQ